MDRNLEMKWKIINESPDGFEPIYTVTEITTGRDIATNLEYDEAQLIANSKNMFDIISNTRDMLEELYLHYRKKNDKFIDDVNEMITKIDIIKDKVNCKY